MKAVARFAGLGKPLRPFVVAVVAAAIILGTALAGIQRGMDHKVMWGPDNEQWFISIALSDSVYGLHLGYIGYRSVNDKLRETWNWGASDRPDDPALIENSSNGDLINEALQAAASLGPQKPGYLSDQSLMTTLDEDMGEVDYFNIAFRLFGLRIQSYYYLFFTLLAVSALAFIVAFRDNTYALVTLLAMLFAFYVEMHLNLLTEQMPTFPGQRHGSTLALIPMWYFIFALGRKASVTTVVGAVIELAIFILAWRIRGSVSWIFIFLLVLIAANAIRLWMQRPRDTRAWQDLIADAASWPALLLLLSVAANFVYNRVELHPIYFTDDVIPAHGAWHSAYLGLQFVPELISPRVRQWLDTGDPLGYVADRDYADRKHFMPWNGTQNDISEGWISPWTKNYKSKLHEDLLRDAMFETLFRHPLKALKLYAWEKPRATFGIMKSVFRDGPGPTWAWCLLAGGVFGALMLIFLEGEFNARSAVNLVGFSAAAVIFAAVPNVWAYASLHTVADLALLVIVFAQIALALAIFALLAPRKVSSPTATFKSEKGHRTDMLRADAVMRG